MNPSYIRTPPDETVIGRYLDFVKFFDLLQTAELFFARFDRFKDKNEGTLPEAVRASDSFVRDNAELMAETVRASVCASCWFIGNDENQHMWDEFAKQGSGVVIRSTIHRLKQSFAAADGKQFIGEVEYLNFADDIPDRDGRDLTAALCIKERSFKHENEVRALVITDDDQTPGVRVRADLNALVETVVVGPNAGGDLAWWVVKRALRSAGVHCVVLHSRIKSGREYRASKGLGVGCHAEYGYMDLYVVHENDGRWRVELFDGKRNINISPKERFDLEAAAKEHALLDAFHYVTEHQRDPEPHGLETVEWQK